MSVGEMGDRRAEEGRGGDMLDRELATLGADQCVGTFARVWLVRLANPGPEDRNKLFALKVLRKVQGDIITPLPRPPSR